MNPVDTIDKLSQIAIKEPSMTMFLVSMGLVGFALYVVLQALKKKP